MRNIKKVLLSLILLSVLFLLSLTTFIAYYKPAPPVLSKSQLVVILGAGYQVDGTPVPALAKRLQKGLEVWKSLKVSNQDIYFLLSGRDREVHVMKEYLVAEGVSSSFIIKDTNGTNTKKTILNTKQIQKNYSSSPIFISQAYHLPRMKLYAWYYKVDAQFVASDRLPIQFHKLFWPSLRESLAIVQFLITVFLISIYTIFLKGGKQ
ncbi:MAG: YdcF family protein [Brevinema sp.]